MRCPFCSSNETRVIDSRLADGGETVRRRRECQVCHERFTTFERSELRLPQIIKSDGRREPFAENKLRRGIRRSLEKRPIDTEAVEAAVNRILHKIMVRGEREFSSQSIGEMVMTELRRMDDIAFVRFASVYRSFQDLKAFIDEVERLQSEPSATELERQLSLLPSGTPDPANDDTNQ